MFRLTFTARVIFIERKDKCSLYPACLFILPDRYAIITLNVLFLSAWVLSAKHSVENPPLAVWRSAVDHGTLLSEKKVVQHKWKLFRSIQFWPIVNSHFRTVISFRDERQGSAAASLAKSTTSSSKSNPGQQATQFQMFNIHLLLDL